jgi:hypothetical protein
MILYHLQNGHLAHMSDRLNMVQIVSEQTEHSTVVRIYYGQLYQELDYLMHQMQQELVLK